MKFFLKVELLLGFIALIIGLVASYWVYHLGLTRILVDENSHLNLTRQAIDSMTPGISQIGFWPPLLHIIMIPAVLSDYLYRSGLAGAVTLIPFLIFSTVLLYRLLNEITEDTFISFWGALLYCCNPYILYYTATPMMEVLYVANLIATAYCMYIWISTHKLRYLLLASIFVSLASISRFEGLLLLPMTFLIVILQLLLQKFKYSKIEATMILSTLLSSLGLMFILGFGYVYGANPLAFLKSDWASKNIVGSLYHPSVHNVLLSLRYFYEALVYMLTRELVIGAFSVFVLLIFSKRKIALFASLLILSTPFVFDFAAVVNGNAVIYVPNMVPYKILNIRYAMYNIGFFIVVLGAGIGIIKHSLDKSNVKIIKFVPIILSYIGIIYVTYTSGKFLHAIFVEDTFSIVRDEAADYPYKEQKAVAAQLKKEYDYGKVLITRGLNDFVVVDSGLPLSSFVFESNYKYYNQTLGRPWLFARYVVTFHPDVAQANRWTYKTEKISETWSNNSIFNQNYTLVYENNRQRLYKINEDSLERYAINRGYDPAHIPALHNLKTWNPDTIYQMMKKTKRPIVADELDQKLSTYYEKQLKTAYSKGFYTDINNKGNSESQSYALLQSFYQDDKQTFAKVWLWTKTNIQRNDGLFSWSFSVENNQVKILDTNPATDADIDIAYALLLAGEKWNNKTYIEEAQNIIQGIWDEEVVQDNGRYFLAAGNWAETAKYIVINPSYISPYAFRLFARYDDHNWDKVVDDAYIFLTEIRGLQVEDKELILPPNWLIYSKETKEYQVFTDMPNSLSHSQDAFRVSYRVAKDYIVNNDQRAYDYLNSINIFQSDWQKNDRHCTDYFVETDKCYMTTSGMTAPLSIYIATDPEQAENYVEKQYLTAKNLAFESESFYQRSWYWFALKFWDEAIRLKY